eukprot:EG_transcript_18082
MFYPHLYTQALAAQAVGGQAAASFQQPSQLWTPAMLHQQPAAEPRGPPWQRHNPQRPSSWSAPRGHTAPAPTAPAARGTAPARPASHSAPAPAPAPAPSPSSAGAVAAAGPAAPPTMKRIVKHQPTQGADLARSSQGGCQRLEIIDPKTMEEVVIVAPEGVPLAPIVYEGPKPPTIPEGVETIEVCDDEGGPPPEPTQQMDAAFLQSIVEHMVSGGDESSPFLERDHQCYMFSVTSLNDGEMRQYDGTLNEIWRTMLADVRHMLKETNLSDECEAVVMGDDPSFELLLTA